MKKSRLVKLSLSKETIRTLSDRTLNGVGGGGSTGSDTGSALCSDSRVSSGCSTCTGYCTLWSTLTI